MGGGAPGSRTPERKPRRDLRDRGPNRKTEGASRALASGMGDSRCLLGLGPSLSGSSPPPSTSTMGGPLQPPQGPRSTSTSSSCPASSCLWPCSSCSGSSLPDLAHPLHFSNICNSSPDLCNQLICKKQKQTVTQFSGFCTEEIRNRIFAKQCEIFLQVFAMNKSKLFPRICATNKFALRCEIIIWIFATKK